MTTASELMPPIRGARVPNRNRFRIPGVEASVCGALLYWVLVPLASASGQADGSRATIDLEAMLNILTGVLAVATVWLAVATQLMARATRRAVDLEATPYLSFASPQIVIGRISRSAAESDRSSAVKLGIVLRNPGKIRIQYEVRSLRMTLSSTTIENPTFSAAGTYIFPGEQVTYWFGDLRLKGDIVAPVHGTAEFEIEYWGADPRRKSSLSQALTYSVLNLDPFDLTWLNTRLSYT